MKANMIHKKTLFSNSQLTNRKYSICTPKIREMKESPGAVQKDINYFRLSSVVTEGFRAELQERQDGHQDETIQQHSKQQTRH